tara:strand:+ start:792 stop:1163 length:372 start_codon:yes stop_codon:yes gene_type:complete
MKNEKVKSIESFKRINEPRITKVKTYLDQKEFIKSIYFMTVDCNAQSVISIYDKMNSPEKPSRETVRRYLLEFYNELPQNLRGKRNRVKLNKLRLDTLQNYLSKNLFPNHLSSLSYINSKINK